MDGFSISGAWTQGYRFVAQGTLVHFLILVLIGIAAPLGLQYAIVGAPIDASPSPMTSGPSMMQMVGAPMVLLTLALSHLLQAGSYFASLRFGFDAQRTPAGAVAWGLAAGIAATLIIAAAYVLAFFGGWAFLMPETVVLAIIFFALPLVVVYALFFLAGAIMAAATIIVLLAFLFVYGAIQGYPDLVLIPFGGSGLIVVVMLVLSYLLFWLAARFSCVLPLMAERGDLNVFTAIAESWRLTWEEQWRITRYIALVGFGIALAVIGISLAVGVSTGELMRGGTLGVEGGTGELVLRFVFGIPIAFLSVMLPAGIYRRLVGEATPVEIFD
jgi:hypothetical protein